jgi:hypothetical protein
LGLFILINIWAAPDAVAKVISASGDFIMTGSALFAPYAFNQLSQIFGRRTPGGGSTDPAKPQYAVKVDRNQMLADVDPD